MALHCPVDECEWWVPDGMEYLRQAHEHEVPFDDDD